MARPEQPTKGPVPGDAGARARALELAHRLLGPSPESRLGRRDYLVALTAEHRYADLAPLSQEAERGATVEALRGTEHILLLQSRKEGFRIVGSARLVEPRSEPTPAVEVSGLAVPDDPWHADGAITERNLLVLHGAIRVAKARDMSDLSLLVAPELLANLIASSSHFRLLADRPADRGTVWASVELNSCHQQGFDAVLFDGRGLDRLAYFHPNLLHQSPHHSSSPTISPPDQSCRPQPGGISSTAGTANKSRPSFPLPLPETRS